MYPEMIYFALALTSTHNFIFAISLIHLVNHYLIAFSFRPNFPWSAKWISFLQVGPNQSATNRLVFICVNRMTVSDFPITKIKWRTNCLTELCFSVDNVVVFPNVFNKRLVWTGAVWWVTGWSCAANFTPWTNTKPILVTSEGSRSKKKIR